MPQAYNARTHINSRQYGEEMETARGAKNADKVRCKTRQSRDENTRNGSKQCMSGDMFERTIRIRRRKPLRSVRAAPCRRTYVSPERNAREIRDVTFPHKHERTRINANAQTRARPQQHNARLMHENVSVSATVQHGCCRARKCRCCCSAHSKRRDNWRRETMPPQ